MASISHKCKLKKTLPFLLMLLALAIPLASASITANNPVDLGYGNSTYSELPAGTYTNITRINNVWYVDGSEFPAAPVGPTPTPEPMTAEDAAGLAIVFFLISIAVCVGLVVAIKR